MVRGPVFNWLRERVLFERARRLLGGRPAAPRLPLVIVPGILGSRLAVPGGRLIWGDVPSFYAPPCTEATFATVRAQPCGLVEGITTTPGLWQLPFYRDLLNFLEQHCGYERGKTLIPFDNDFRLPTADVVRALVERVTGLGERSVVLFGHSHGGVVASLAARKLGPARVRGVIALATAFRGAIDNLRMMNEGYRPAPLGFHFGAELHARVPAAVDALPAPGVPWCADERGRTIDADLYDVATWERLEMGIFGAARRRMARAAVDECAGILAAGLARAKAWHAARPAATVPHRVLGANGLPTLVRALKAGPGLKFPKHAEARRVYGEPAEALYAPGDGEVPVESLAAWSEPAGAVEAVAGTHRGLLNVPEAWVAVARALAAFEEVSHADPARRAAGQ